MNAPAKAAKASPNSGDGTQDIKAAIAAVTPRISPLLAADLWARDGVKLQAWDVVPAVGTPFENVLRPEFWANVSAKFKPGATLLVYPGDGAWYAELIVFDSGQNWANVGVKVGPIKRPEFAATPGVLDNFEVRYHPSKGWQAIEKSSNRVLKDNFANAEEARRWFMDNQRTMRR